MADPAPPPDDEEDDEEDEKDKRSAPKPFERPKGLLKVKPEDIGDFDVKSGASTAPPPPPAARPAAPAPPPPGAQVKMDKPAGGPKPPLARPEDLGPIKVRFQTGEGGPKPKIPTAEDMSQVDVKFQKGAPKLPKFEPIDKFDVVIPHASPEPKPKEVPPTTPLEGDVEVVDYRKTGPVEVSAADVFSTKKRIGVVDTTFARHNMGGAAEKQLEKLGGDYEVVRRTVPGVKDLAVECKILIEKYACEIVVACGMVGRMPVDKTCAHEASLALQWAQLQTNRHILEVFVHEEEAKDERQLAWLMEQRTVEHAENAWRMLFDPEWLRQNAGKGLRQGFADAGPVRAR